MHIHGLCNCSKLWYFMDLNDLIKTKLHCIWYFLCFTFLFIHQLQQCFVYSWVHIWQCIADISFCIIYCTYTWFTAGITDEFLDVKQKPVSINLTTQTALSSFAKAKVRQEIFRYLWSKLFLVSMLEHVWRMEKMINIF